MVCRLRRQLRGGERIRGQLRDEPTPPRVVCQLPLCAGWIANLVWTDSRSDKWRPFIEKNLTHFIDDQVEVLVSIRGACWERRSARPPPALFLVPTAWTNGKFNNFGRTCSDAARASESWSEAWAIYPQSSVGGVRPWEWVDRGAADN